MRERGLQRRAPSFVGRLHLVKDAPPRQLQTFAFLTPLDFLHVRTALAARGALVLRILPVRLNCLAFESSCHGKIGVHVARLCASIVSKMRLVTADAKHVIENFESLPDQEKIEVLAEIIRLSRDIEYPEMAEDELRSAADHVFLDYDRREAAE